MSTFMQDFLSDISIIPVSELFSSLVNFVSQTSNVSTCNGTISDSIVVEISANEFWLYFTFKFFWLLFLTATALAAFGFVLYRLYVCFFVPLNRIRRLGSLGYIKGGEAGMISKKDIANMIRRRRKIGVDLPPVYPNGWFRLLDSGQIKNGEVKEVCALGEHFAVYRSQSGKVSVLDAYCPHMGANLAVGGRVKGECLECPFHGWVFNEDGKCVEIPYAEKIPNVAKTKCWSSREVNGMIFVWYHCDGIPPEWEIPEVKEITDGTYRYGGRAEHHTNTHVQDLPENGADVAHLYFLHKPHVFAGSHLPNAFDSWSNFICKLKISMASAGSTKENPHILRGKITSSTLYFDKWKAKGSIMDMEQIGPGITHMHVNTPLGSGIIIQTMTPSEPLHQVFAHNIHLTRRTPLCFAKLLLLAEAIQTDRDVTIWNNKFFEHKPVLVKEDKLITQFRRWYSQFYSENSPRLSMKNENDMQW